jgi:predicted NodU family carbamoyl transferase
MINVGVSRVHNSAVTLLKDGEIEFHIENERLSNIKYDAYPFHALAKLPEHVSFVDNVCLAGVGKNAKHLLLDQIVALEEVSHATQRASRGEGERQRRPAHLRRLGAHAELSELS